MTLLLGTHARFFADLSRRFLRTLVSAIPEWDQKGLARSRGPARDTDNGHSPGRVR
ncbi:MAG: hypothetical protein JWO38_86 [Gemmataceae bacterium]|nr:hypothetical protein [Gemmataceae bacterium]